LGFLGLKGVEFFSNKILPDAIVEGPATPIKRRVRTRKHK
jgi:hypothetical protein